MRDEVEAEVERILLDHLAAAEARVMLELHPRIPLDKNMKSQLKANFCLVGGSDFGLQICISLQCVFYLSCHRLTMLCKVLLWGGSVEEQVRLEGGQRLELDAAPARTSCRARRVGAAGLAAPTERARPTAATVVT